MNLEKTKKFEVLIASDGATGLKLARENRPDFIFCDILMPEMSGYEVARVLSENKTTKDIPLIFLTALATREEVISRRSPDGRYYLSKPVTTEDIIAFINTL